VSTNANGVGQPVSATVTDRARGSQRAVVTALVGNACIAALKFTAGFVTGSSAMVSEGFHSCVDVGDQAMLLLGQRRSRRPPDESHPFGYSRELYFWALIVAVTFFGIGGGLSVYEGVLHVLRPEPIVSPLWNYLTIAGAAVFESVSLAVGYREFRRQAGPETTVWRAFREGRDPSLYTVVVEDSTDLIGLGVAALAVLLSVELHAPRLDGLGSIVIGLVLGTAAVLLVRESWGLIVGEGASPQVTRDLQAIAQADPGVRRSYVPLTVYLGPERLVVAFRLEFEESLTAGDVALAAQRIERAVRERFPDVGEVTIEPARPAGADGAGDMPDGA